MSRGNHKSILNEKEAHSDFHLQFLLLIACHGMAGKDTLSEKHIESMLRDISPVITGKTPQRRELFNLSPGTIKSLPGSTFQVNKRSDTAISLGT